MSLLLRSFPRAEYAAKPLLHYALGKTAYAHFTSPIRRYADLTVHQQLWNLDKKSRTRRVETLERVAEKCTELEEQNDNASFAASDRMKLRILEEELERAFVTDIYVKRNYLTTIKGNILTDGKSFDVTIEDAFAGELGTEDGKTFANVDTAEELLDAINKGIENITVEDDIDLNDLLTAGTLATRATTDPSLAIKAGKKINIDLGGFTLSATSSQTGKNYDMIDVRGTLSIKNGAIECKHEGNNMEWNNSTNVFNVTAGGVLNLDSVTAKNLGGSDMAFVAHLNNWGEVTLNVDNSTLESTYIAVRVFNSGNDMNNVTIKNSTLKGGKHAFWVHNYTLADFGNDADKTAAHKALLNLNIYVWNECIALIIDAVLHGVNGL